MHKTERCTNGSLSGRVYLQFFQTTWKFKIVMYYDFKRKISCLLKLIDIIDKETELQIKTLSASGTFSPYSTNGWIWICSRILTVTLGKWNAIMMCWLIPLWRPYTIVRRYLLLPAGGGRSVRTVGNPVPRDTHSIRVVKTHRNINKKILLIITYVRIFFNGVTNPTYIIRRENMKVEDTSYTYSLIIYQYLQCLIFN